MRACTREEATPTKIPPACPSIHIDERERKRGRGDLSGMVSPVQGKRCVQPGCEGQEGPICSRKKDHRDCGAAD